MIDIPSLIKDIGEPSAKALLLDYFRKPENLADFAALFPDHVEFDQADYQNEMMQLSADPKERRLLFAAPRGSGKSTITDIVVLAWFHLYKISPFTVLLSDTSTQSGMQLDALADELVNNELIKWLFGEVKGETWNSQMIIIKSPFGESAIVSKGAGQKIRGLKWRRYRPFLIVIDDLENEEMVESEQQRKKIERWFRFALLRAMAKSGRIIYIGTVLHDNALLNRIIKGDPIFGVWTVRKYKAIKDDGSSFWPERFPIEDLVGMRDDPKHPDYIGSLVFSQEMMHEPASEKDRIIPEGWLKYYNRRERGDEWVEELKIYGGIDPASAEDPDSSEFSFTTIGLDSEGFWWILDIIHGRFSVSDQVEKCLTCIERWNHDLIGIESIQYQRVLGQLLKNEGRKRTPQIIPRIKQLFTDKSKLRRMTLHSAKFQGGLVHIDRSHPESGYLAERLTQFPAEPNDVPDSLMLAFETVDKPRGRAFAKKPGGM